MNIKQAKQEIINTVQAYLTKDETGEYAIPVERQRPVLLIGPPGIGKTAIMEQVAQCKYLINNFVLFCCRYDRARQNFLQLRCRKEKFFRFFDILSADRQPV